jgi:ribosomal protein S18 acetylase RimI-like enzyme
MPTPVIEPATAADLAVLDALLEDAVPAVWRAVLRGPLHRAIRAPGPEERALVARDRLGGAAAGFALFGEVAGARGAGRLRVVAVAPLARRRGVGRALVDGVVVALRESGARFVLAEVPDEPDARCFAVLLEGCGFHEEARAADLVREGVAMRYVRRAT